MTTLNPTCGLNLLHLQGRNAIVTGGSRGIGKAIAEALGAAGVRMVLVALHEPRLHDVCETMAKQGIVALPHAGDVAESQTAVGAVKLAHERFGGVDILVNCAGIISRQPAEATSDEDWSRVMRVNLDGCFYFCREALPQMRTQKRGKIINISSQMAFMAHPKASPSYEASKAGMTALTRHIALHYAPFGVCANAIAPGSIDTDLPKSMPEETRERLRAAIPQKRLGEPEEVASLALFLASDHSNYISGQTIPITGGSLMR
jgi:3-oxoacyl-[acyl-carrier protein] reductase